MWSSPTPPSPPWPSAVRPRCRSWSTSPESGRANWACTGGAARPGGRRPPGGGRARTRFGNVFVNRFAPARVADIACVHQQETNGSSARTTGAREKGGDDGEELRKVPERRATVGAAGFVRVRVLRRWNHRASRPGTCPGHGRCRDSAPDPNVDHAHVWNHHHQLQGQQVHRQRSGQVGSSGPEALAPASSDGSGRHGYGHQGSGR